MYQESGIYDYKYFCYRFPSHDLVKGLRRLTNNHEILELIGNWAIKDHTTVCRAPFL